MTSDMAVPAGSYKRNYWIMQDFSRMSDPMSWHPVHRTFSVNVWCFVIAQLMAICVWLKLWLAGAFNHGLQPDLLIFQGDLTSCYKKFDWKIDLGFSRCPSPAECFYKKGLRKLVLEDLHLHRNLLFWGTFVTPPFCQKCCQSNT